MPSLTLTSGNDSYEVIAAGSYDISFLAGDDVLTTRHGGANTIANMGDGDDLVSHRAGVANVAGGLGSDRFEVYASGLTADGGGDDDLFNIRGGTDLVLRGGSGSDRFNFYNGSAAVANILIEGGDGNDDFFGYHRAVGGSIYGQGGNDYFVTFGNFGGNSVTLFGGTGNDIYRAHHASPATFVENVGEGTDSVQVARGTSYILPSNIENISVQGFHGSTTGAAALSGNGLNNVINGHANVETIFGLGGNDRIAAKGGDDTVWGGSGNDYLDGNDGNDVLFGEDGNDTLQGRAGSDAMTGGAGDDVYYVDTYLDQVIEAADGGTDLIRTSWSIVLPDNVENGILSGTANLNLSGNGIANELTGNSGDNELYGWAGDDIVRGGGGQDHMIGAEGNDILQGGAGDDSIAGGGDSDLLNGGDGDDNLFGEDGDDVLVGGLGADDLVGGEGLDRFVYSSVAESPAGAPDHILFFSSVAGIDTLDLSAIDANTNVAGDQAFTIRHGGVPTGAAGDLWWTQDAVTKALTWYGDVNGDGIADLQIVIQTSPTAGAIWFSDMIL